MSVKDMKCMNAKLYCRCYVPSSSCCMIHVLILQISTVFKWIWS